MNKLGIIPAAGKAVRWGGFLKELLPIREGETFLSRAVKSMLAAGADTCLVITNPEKIQEHARHLHGLNVTYRLQTGTMDLWSAIVESFCFEAKWNLFQMPDTLIPDGIFDGDMYAKDFNIGSFYTDKPERFGIIINDQIIDKPDDLKGQYPAYGVLTWTNSIVEFWKNNLVGIKNHTEAINFAMGAYGYHNLAMPFYRDMASFTDYQEFIHASVH